MRYRIAVHADAHTRLKAMAEDVLRGLGSRPRSLPPKYFYDAEGSRLFEEITRLPEYYLTRAEDALLDRLAPTLMRALTGSEVLVANKLRTQGIEAVKLLDESDPAVLGDRDQLTQVFINLITNAADAMSSGGRLTVRTEVRRIQDVPYVSARVTDTGTGIAEEHREKIFESFFTTKPEGKGTGLGLAICRRAMLEHDGTLEIDSEPGKGTTVHLALPAI